MYVCVSINTRRHTHTYHTYRDTQRHTLTRTRRLPRSKGEYHCNILPYCNILQHTATHCNTLQHTATHCNTLEHAATRCNMLQHAATRCNTRHTCQLERRVSHPIVVLKDPLCNGIHPATHRNTLQHTATHCNTL